MGISVVMKCVSLPFLQVQCQNNCLYFLSIKQFTDFKVFFNILQFSFGLQYDLYKRGHSFYFGTQFRIISSKQQDQNCFNHLKSILFWKLILESLFFPLAFVICVWFFVWCLWILILFLRMILNYTSAFAECSLLSYLDNCILFYSQSVQVGSESLKLFCCYLLLSRFFESLNICIC